MILYWLAKFLTNFFFRVYYKIEYVNSQNVPKGKPVVLAPNHVNAFIDPVVVATYPRLQKVRFFARGDVFKSRIARIALNDLNISPMYRIQEGYAELKKNDKTFEECRSLLRADKTILIHPEATCVQVRRIRPLKKGLARIVFQTAETLNWEKEIYVVPVGLNYSNPRKFRSSILVNFGEPVLVNQFKSEYQSDKVRAINDFTRRVESALIATVVNVADHANERLVEEIEEIALHQWMDERGGSWNSLVDRNRFSAMIIDMVNELSVNDHAQLNQLKNTLAQYLRRLYGNDLRDHLLRPDLIGKMNFLNFLGEFFVLFLGFPVYTFAWLLNNPPYHLGRRFADKKIKSHEFYASVRLNISMIYWLVYYGLQLLCVALVFRNWSLLGVYALAVPLLGFYSLIYYPRFKKILGRWNLLRMVRKERLLVQELVESRSQILHQLNSLMQPYFRK